MSNSKKAIEPDIPIAEFTLTDNLKDLEDVEEKYEYWCKGLLKNKKFTIAY